MNRLIVTLAVAGLSAATLTGCGGNTYQPKASETELSAYAGKSNYPYSAKAEEAPHMFAEVAPDATITLFNAGDESYINFEIWVNKTYTLHIDKLSARNKISVAPGTLYNGTGMNMGGTPAASITSVQVYNKDKLLDVQGPILPQ